ncbi:MAG TPA: family 43 glycosylhydrolase [Verrucomicrobiae bacterium]|jgi:autotransporter-associated beta strand protein
MKKTVRNLRFLKLAKGCLVIVWAGLLGTAVSPAATVTLKTDDAAGTTSFTGSANWNPVGMPVPGNSYFTGAHVIRSVNNTTTGKTNVFGGDSLSIDAGGRFLGKVGNNAAGNTTVANNTANYVLNGGLMDQAGANNDSSICVIDGTVTVTADSLLGAFGATSSGSASFETLDIIAPINGSAALQVSGANVNAGADTGLVRLSAANPYRGILTVTNANNNIIASAVQRLLQLNNLNALSNATLNLVAASVNPVSFSNAVNSAAFNLGGLSGTSSQTLSDTAGNAVTLTVGGNNTSSAFGGGLTGIGSLVKVGTGMLALSGQNTFSGVTVISNGTVVVSGNGSVTSSINIAGNSATLDVSGLSSSSLTLANGQTLSGIGLVKGSITMSPASTFSPGNDGLGILTVLANLTLNTGSSNRFTLSPSASDANNLALVGGTLTCNHSLICIHATGGAVNLDTSDYVLFQATNGIIGACAATPVFLGALPANASHYTVITGGNTVVLHYNTHIPPTSVITASPTSLTWGQSTFVRVTTVNGDGAVTGVTLDASAIGGSSSVPLVLDSTTSNVWTNTVTVNANAGVGDRTLTATVTDANSLSGASGVSLTVMPPSLAIQNPVLPSHHADPFISYFAGKYWIYPTSEDTKSFRAFSSTNLVDWVDQGAVFNLSQSSWATNGYGWAPCVVYFNGNYYFYYAMGGAAGWQDSKIGVAVGPSPIGPFTDSGTPLVSSQTSSPHVEAIDPMIFMDTDGKAYLYYGGSGGANLGIRQLNTNDLISFSGSLNVVTPANFTEASFMSKRNGTYYISYSNGSWQTNTYNVRYATASSPLGPWTYRGPILTSDSLHKGPGSHAFLQIPDTDIWYICYHYWDSAYSTRHVALDSLSYNPDGTIKPVVMTGGGTVARWESYSVPGYYIVHTNSIAKLVNSDWTDVTSQFLMVPGLADKATNAVSFELIDKADRYLRQNSSGQIVMDVWTAGGTFNADATFYLRPGLSGGKGISFESYSSPGHYIRQINTSLYSQPGSGSPFTNDATWKSWTASTLSGLQIASTNGQRVVVTWNATWNGAGTLLEATDLNGVWTANSSAVSPWVVPTTNAVKFYKVEP